MNLLPTKSLCLLSLASMLLALSVQADDWYRWRGPDLNGISKETGWQSQWPAEGPKQLWKASVGMGVASISVSQGRAFTTGNNGSDTDTIFCLDAATGAEIWKHSYPCDLDAHFWQGGTTATPTVDGDRVYSVSKKGDLFCFDAAKGTIIWSKSIIKDYGIEPNTWGFSS
jgi:outer membrane protein assembly factor BamB